MKKSKKSVSFKKADTKLSETQVKALESHNNIIEELDLSEMTEKDMNRVITSFSEEGLQLRKNRKEIRYQLYRLRTEAEGKASSDSEEKFRTAFTSQPLFDGWRFFGTTWDVAFDDPMRIVHKDKSEQQEWDELVAAKFPTIDENGKVSYPDITVRKKVEAFNKQK